MSTLLLISAAVTQLLRKAVRALLIVSGGAGVGGSVVVVCGTSLPLSRSGGSPLVEPGTVQNMRAYFFLARDYPSLLTPCAPCTCIAMATLRPLSTYYLQQLELVG